jgi:hypothetical protein
MACPDLAPPLTGRDHLEAVLHQSGVPQSAVWLIGETMAAINPARLSEIATAIVKLRRERAV